jgi:hypothetical protein
MRLSYKYICENVPTEVRQKLMDLVESESLGGASNFRYAPRDDNEGLDEFEDIARSGNCGTFEREITDNSGRKWLVGCNYDGN